jgi:hypothetical protein
MSLGLRCAIAIRPFAAPIAEWDKSEVASPSLIRTLAAAVATGAAGELTSEFRFRRQTGRICSVFLRLCAF